MVLGTSLALVAPPVLGATRGSLGALAGMPIGGLLSLLVVWLPSTLSGTHLGAIVVEVVDGDMEDRRVGLTRAMRHATARSG